MTDAPESQAGISSFASESDDEETTTLGTRHRTTADTDGADEPVNNCNGIKATDGHVEQSGALSWWHKEHDGVHSPSRRDADSLLPYGRVLISLVDESEHVEFGYGRDLPVNAGVYLSGKDEQDWLDRPPSPVALSDTHLQFAAEWALHVTRDIVANPADVVAVTKEAWGSLNIALSSQSESQRVRVGSLGGVGQADQDQYQGFSLIRTFDTPCELYTKCYSPRLELGDLRADALKGFMNGFARQTYTKSNS